MFSGRQRSVQDVVLVGRDGAAVTQLMAELKTGGGFAISQGALEALREVYGSGRVSEKETKETIGAMAQRTGEILCPHTAVGVRVAEAHIDPGRPMVTLATAHPAKFPDAVEGATGERPPLPNRMADLYDRSERLIRVPNDLAAVEELIEERMPA